MEIQTKVVITLGEINELYDWEKFCEVTGMNYWCMNEGLASGDETISLTIDEAKRCGIPIRQANENGQMSPII